MNLVSITPNFIVKNLQASIAFYRERLGFQLDYQGPDDGPFWAKVSRDAIGIHFKGNRSRRASMSQSHPPPMGSLGRVHLHPGPGHALQRVPPARCVVCKGVIVHRRGAVGIRDHRCGRVFTCLLSASRQVGLRLTKRSPLTVLRFARSLEPFPTRVHPAKIMEDTRRN